VVRKTVHFLGLLANVNSSILKMQFDHGFAIETFSVNEGSQLVAKLQSTSLLEAGRLLQNYSCLNTSEGQMYVIRNKFEAEVDESKHIFDSLFTPTAVFDSEKIRGYLLQTLRLIRLFKEGNIGMPSWYYFLLDGTEPQFFMSHFSGFSVSEEQFSLRQDELPALLNFLRSTELPFRRDFLQLAFENFELSYDSVRPPLALLSLMMSLETLLNPSEGEIRHRLSRNAAVLLGKDTDESKLISTELKGLYDQRSKLVHTGKANITIEEVRKTRYYVRESIKAIYRIDKEKDEIMELLDSTGYDDKPWLIDATQR